MFWSTWIKCKSNVIKFNTIAGDTSHANLGGGIFIHNQGNSRTVINKNVISDNYGYGVYGDPDSLMYNNIVGNLKNSNILDVYNSKEMITWNQSWRIQMKIESLNISIIRFDCHPTFSF